MDTTINPETRIIDLTVGQLMDLLGKEQAVVANNEPKEKHFVYGLAGIAHLFGCSKTTANRIKQSGKIDGAISQIGNMIIVDADLALELTKKKNISNKTKSYKK
jgi:hypothetical protein